MESSKLRKPTKLQDAPRSLRVFEESIRSPVTRKNYRRTLDDFLKFSQLKDYDTLARTNPKTLQRLVEDFVMELKKKHSSGNLRTSTICTYVAPISLFCSQNDILLNFRKVTRMFPSRQKPTGDNLYTDNEIALMLKFSNVRWRALTHFVASTGVRPGAIFDLKVKHLQDMEEGCMAVKIYADDPEEYWVFLTPEATDSLKEYLKKRELDGEPINPDSPVFRKRYRAGMAQHNVKKIGMHTFYSAFAKVLEKAGIRKRGQNSKYRHEKRLVYGFRKRYNTKLKLNNNINSNIAEKLMGHKNGLDGVYLKPTLEQCFNEFKKAIPDLTIDNSERHKIALKKLQKEKSELEDRIPELVKKAVEVAKEEFLKSHSFR